MGRAQNRGAPVDPSQAPSSSHERRPPPRCCAGWLSFTNFTTGHSHSFGGEYLELVPNERIVHTDQFDDPNLPGQMKTTIELDKVSCGTQLRIVQEGVPSVVPLEGCYLGWQESLTLLAQLVEPEIDS